VRIYVKEFIHKRGVFVFSDPGGAKAILALAHQVLGSQNVTSFIILSDRSYSFTEDFGLQVKHASKSTLTGILSSFNPEYIFTGTSYTSELELLALHWGNKNAVRTYSFIDHWTNMASRFILKGKYLFPNETWVVDSTAKRMALREGVRSLRIRCVGNPYHHFLKTWRPTRSRQALYSSLGVETSKQLILFAPDPLTNAGGIDKFGFDEQTTLHLLLNTLKSMPIAAEFHLLIKCHPNQDRAILQKTLVHFQKKTAFSFSVLTEASIPELLYYSEVTIGMFSSILLEAAIFKKKLIVLLPGIKITDPLEHLLANTVRIKTQEQLLISLKQALRSLPA